MDHRRGGRARKARRWIVGSIWLAAVVISAAPAQAAEPFVRVHDVALARTGHGALVTATVDWNAAAVREHDMTVGDLRLVAVGEHGHLPLLLGARSRAVSSSEASQRIVFLVADRRRLAAMHRGNRVVLTASQHARPGQVSRTTRTYVTVAQVQPFGSPQPHIGTDDCSDRAIVPGAQLHHCDLVGADLDGAQVSIHDDKGRLSTRMERADLTGATLVRADVSGASIAGGRINGADMTRAKLDNLSLAGADAVELRAQSATSDEDERDSGADLFATDLTGADLRDTIFKGVSIAHARLNGAQLQDARWTAPMADGADLRDADLHGATLRGASTYFTDFRGADLGATDVTDIGLQWALLCRTRLPAESSLDPQRDCRTAVEAALEPVPTPDRPDPYVTIRDATLGSGPGPRTVKATIRWDAASRAAAGYGMNHGDLRLIAVDGATGRPTVLDTETIDDLPETTDYTAKIDGRDKPAAMGRGNRIVLTATQHPPLGRSGKLTERSYVTVEVLQRGPGRGRVGRYDCSRMALTRDAVTPLDFCDLTGATLTTAALGTRSMREVDLTGADMQRGSLTAVFLDGAHFAGLDASGAGWADVSAFDAWGPGLRLADGMVDGSPLLSRNLDDADFQRAKLYDSVALATTSLRRADFTDARLTHADLAYADLAGAQLDGVESTGSSSLFLADLTRADLSGSAWDDDETGKRPWLWATLCHTAMPAASGGIDGDRDCPR